MVGDELIPDEAKALLGKEVGYSDIEVEKEPIKRYAEAIMDPNPLYVDSNYAKQCGYRGIIAPPTFVSRYIGIGALPRLSGKFATIMGGEEWEFLEPVEMGDVITRTYKLADLYQREGRTGKMVFMVLEWNFTNQHGQRVAIYRLTIVNRLVEGK